MPHGTRLRRGGEHGARRRAIDALQLEEIEHVAEADPFFEALAVDDTIPIEREAVRLWLADLESPLKWVVLPVLRGAFLPVVVDDLAGQTPVPHRPSHARAPPVADLLVLPALREPQKPTS